MYLACPPNLRTCGVVPPSCMRAAVGFCVCISRVACLGAEPLTQLTFQPVHPHLVLGYLQTVPSCCGCSPWTRISGHCSDAAKLWVLTSSKGLSAHTWSQVTL